MRVFSFANESTRYCNYSRDKFDNELTFIKPSWFISATKVAKQDETFNKYCVTDRLPIENEEWFIMLITYAETAYINAIKRGFTPQQAREVLPLCTKSELVMTGFESDWKEFFDKRLKGTTGKPHPDMMHLCELAQEELTKNGIIL